MTKVNILGSVLAVIALSTATAFAEGDEVPTGSLLGLVDTSPITFKPSITDDNSIKTAVSVFAKDMNSAKVQTIRLMNTKGLAAFQISAAQQAKDDLDFVCREFPKWLVKQSTVHVAVDTYNAAKQEMDRLLLEATSDIQALSVNINTVKGITAVNGESIDNLVARYNVEVPSMRNAIDANAGDITEIRNDPTLARYRFAKVSDASPIQVVFSGVDGVQVGPAYDGLIPLVCKTLNGPQDFEIYSSGDFKADVCMQNLGTATRPTYKFYRGKHAIVNGAVGTVMTQVDDGALSSKGWKTLKYLGATNSQWQEMRNMLASHLYEPKVEKAGGGYSAVNNGSTSASKARVAAVRQQVSTMLPIGHLSSALAASGSQNAIADNDSNAGHAGNDNYSIDISGSGKTPVNVNINTTE